MNVIFHNGMGAPQDVWACVYPAVHDFLVNDGGPYGKGNAIEYTYSDKRAPGLEITIKVWRASDGIHAEWVTG